jgi:rod shape determining protein RodA
VNLRQSFAIDLPLLGCVALLVLTGLLTMYSAALDFPGRFELHLRNIAIAAAIMVVVARIPPPLMMKFAAPVYSAGVVLLVAVALAGINRKGSQRWIYLGAEFQPSEMMKIATPLMLAWFFHQYSHIQRWQKFSLAGLLLLLPFLLIAEQPDLGTALLVGSAGFYVILLAGLPWKAIATIAVGTVLGAPLFWHLLYDYQRDRILTLLNPGADPLGKGFQVTQAGIAIGSGGVSGKGWLAGSQGHLGFIPERSTDFVFSVYAEEFGLAGNIVLVLMYALLIVRGLQIASNATTQFSRLLAAAITMILFTYAFVNLAMVSGIAPVVGVPLPFMSYGGTALVTLGLACGILLSVQRQTLRP